MRDSRPDLASATDAELVARARSLQRHLRAMFSQVVWAALGSSVGSGILPTLIGDLDPTAISKLITGIGDVDSTEIAARIFAISRQVNSSTEMTGHFQAGPDGLIERVAASGSDDAEQFLAAVAAFVYEHGSRGPNEYDPYSWSYESRPSLLHQAIEHARGASDDADPVRTIAAGAVERRRLIEHFQGIFADNPEVLGMFDAAVGSLAVFMAARERCKSNYIRVVGEVRGCFLQVGRRATAAGHLAHERQIFMLLADEVDAFLAAPGAYSATLAEREVDYLSLYDLEPPYIVNVAAPPLGEWTRKDSISVAPVEVGQVLTGVAGSPGRATGTARILLGLADARC